MLQLGHKKQTTNIKGIIISGLINFDEFENEDIESHFSFDGMFLEHKPLDGFEAAQEHCNIYNFENRDPTPEENFGMIEPEEDETDIDDWFCPLM